MTFEELKKSDSEFVLIKDIAPVLGVNPQSLRVQIKQDSSKLGFPVTVIGHRILIPREPFVKYVKG